MFKSYNTRISHVLIYEKRLQLFRNNYWKVECQGTQSISNLYIIHLLFFTAAQNDVIENGIDKKHILLKMFFKNAITSSFKVSILDNRLWKLFNTCWNSFNYLPENFLYSFSFKQSKNKSTWLINFCVAIVCEKRFYNALT